MTTGRKRVHNNAMRTLAARWRVQAHLDFMWMTKDLRFFLINVVADVILNLAGVTAVFLLAERFGGIGHWSRDQIIFMLGYAALVRGFLDVGFSYNVLHISRRIGRGQLDHLLVQPQPLWIGLLTEGFMPFSGCWSLLTGIGITAWAIAQFGTGFPVQWWLWFAANLLASCTVALAFSFLWGALAFWAPLAAEEISSRAVNFLYQLKAFPLDGLSGVVLTGMLSVLPVGFVAWYPCRQLLGIAAPQLWHTPLAALLLTLAAVNVFKKGMEHYAETGSQRYIGWGHRS